MLASRCSVEQLEVSNLQRALFFGRVWPPSIIRTSKKPLENRRDWIACHASASAQIAADHLGYGWSAEEIVRQYPHLTHAEVHAALAYYFDHCEEIDAELAAELAELDRTAQQAPSALRLRLLGLRRGEAA